MGESKFMRSVREAAECADVESYPRKVDKTLSDEKITRTVSGVSRLADHNTDFVSKNGRGEVFCEARLICCKSGETLLKLKGSDVCSADVLIAAAKEGMELKDGRLQDPNVKGKSLYAVEVQRTQRIFLYNQPRGRRSSGRTEEWE